jgi:flagellar hook assembly protein FlgD
LAAATPSDPSVTPFEVALPVVPAAVELTSQSTEIEVRIPAECDVEIQVVDESGSRVCGARVHMPAGTQKFAFSGHDARGRTLPNGVYYYSVVIGDDVSTTRVTITR